MFPESQFILSFPTEKDPQIPGIKIYTPVNIMEGYHTSRLQQATLENMYASSGATEDCIKDHLDAIIELCNQTGELTTIRTDIAGVANALKVRTKYPVDKQCGVRMGIVLSFASVLEGDKWVDEEPDKIQRYWIDKKMALALEHPSLYSFFFGWGVINTPAYSNLLDSLNDLDYFEKRMMNILAILPEKLSRLSRI